MTTHARQKIREAIAALMDEMPTTGRRVYPSRVFSLDETELPSWSVFSGPEEVTQITLGAPVYIKRNMTLLLEGHAMADIRIDQVLDTMAMEAEQVLAQVITVDGKVLPTILKSTDFEFSDDGELQIGLVRLTYLIPYVTAETTPETLA